MNFHTMVSHKCRLCSPSESFFCKYQVSWSTKMHFYVKKSIILTIQLWFWTLVEYYFGDHRLHQSSSSSDCSRINHYQPFKYIFVVLLAVDHEITKFCWYMKAIPCLFVLLMSINKKKLYILHTYLIVLFIFDRNCQILDTFQSIRLRWITDQRYFIQWKLFGFQSLYVQWTNSQSIWFNVANWNAIIVNHSYIHKVKWLIQRFANISTTLITMEWYLLTIRKSMHYSDESTSFHCSCTWMILEWKISHHASKIKNSYGFSIVGWNSIKLNAIAANFHTYHYAG